MKKYVFSVFMSLTLVFAAGIIIHDEMPALNQKTTFNRLMKAPALTFSKMLNRSCSFRSARADLEEYTAENGFENPGD